MFKTSFDVFISILEKSQLDTTKQTPTIHYFEDEEKFVLYMKGIDLWNVSTQVFKKDILAFGATEGWEPEATISQFRMNYLFHAVPIQDEGSYKLPEDKNPDKKNFLESLQDSGFKFKLVQDNPNGPKVKKDVDPGDDIIEQSESYDDFIVKNFDKWEEKALAALNKIEFQKYYEDESLEYQKEVIIKTFGEFLQGLFNGINASVFIRGIRKFIDKDMKEGLKSAEADTDQDIAVSSVFEDRVLSLAEQELNGYTIHGKKWHGIKGVTNELRNNILKSVRNGVIEKESRSELAQRVKDIFKTAKNSQAERIARTETTRFVNEGKLQGFKDSGAEGKKTWLIVSDDSTSDICKRLSRQYGEKGIGFDEPFRDEATGKEYQAPPGHPNCRSVVGYELPGEKE